MKAGFISYVLLVVVAGVVVTGAAVAFAYLYSSPTPISVSSTQQTDASGSAIPQAVAYTDLSTQEKQSRDTWRKADLLAIVNAVYQYSAENNGTLPGGDSFPTTPTCIGTAEECFNLSISEYIFEIPADPLNGTPENTNYFIYRNEAGRVIASATGELEEKIEWVR